MRPTISMIFCFQIFLLVMWCTNLYKLAKLDFEPSYKAEIIRGIGVITPIFVVTAWLHIAEENSIKE